MPPLELTGERTLPDVPEENYWYRRHLAVYEWIAERGRRACGSPTSPAARATAPTCWPRRAAEVVGVDANPEAHEHARLRYRRPNLRFERDLVEDFDEPVRRGRLPADDRARPRARARCCERFAELAPGRLRLDPEPAHAGAARAPRSPTTPGTCASTRPAEYRELLEPHFAAVEILGLFHARKLRAHELAIELGWDRVHPALRLTKPFYDRFVPAIAASDFALRREATSTGRSTSSPSAMPERRPAGAAGDLAIVLHSHMPYVEGFGTYPFGEEWLFDAVDPLLPAGARGRRAT